MDSTSSFWVSNPSRYEEDSTYNNRAELLFCAWTSLSCPETFRQLIRFSALNDTSVIPTNSTINSVKMVLYGIDTSINNYGNSYYLGTPDTRPNRGWIYELADNFNNLTVTWNLQPGIKHTDSVAIPLSYSRWDENDTFDVTSLVTDMMVNGNYGFMLKLDTEIFYQEHLYASSYYSDSTLHPALIVNYTHHPAGINNINAVGSQMLVYPTLVSSQFNVSLNINQYATVNIQILDMLGKELYSINKYCRSGANNFVIPANNLPAGTYLIRATGENLALTQKIVKM